MKPLKDILFENQNGLCALCKLPITLKKSTIDHIIPLSKGGTNTPDNKQLTHSFCNLVKGDSTEELRPTQYQDLSKELKDKVLHKKFKQK